MGEVRGNAGRGEGREEMWGIKSVLGPHTSINFPTSPPFPSPHAYTFPHSPHTLSHTLPTHLSLPPPTPAHPNTFPYISPHTPIFLPTAPLTSPLTPQHTSLFTPCTLPHLSPHLTPRFDYVAKLPCDDVTLMNLTRKAR